MSKTLIKWPGGKTREIKVIQNMIPDFDRYIEPFFGGGAMYFFLSPQEAVINDISKDLIDFYRLTKEQNPKFKDYLYAYSELQSSLLTLCEQHYDTLKEIYLTVKQQNSLSDTEQAKVFSLTNTIISTLPHDAFEKLILDTQHLCNKLRDNISDKIIRTVKNEQKKPYSQSDLKENLITGYISGLYMYFRDIYNIIQSKRAPSLGIEYRIANFYYIRENCYGSMFRYNAKGEFNVPYGGMSYNRKMFSSKLDHIFSEDTKKLFSGTDIFCSDFESFLNGLELTERDFIFLDPPYDSDFSDYEGNIFSKHDHKRLAELLKTIKAKFILVIKNTDYIYSLYKDDFEILSFDKTYTYNVRSRNDRNAEHLIISSIL